MKDALYKKENNLFQGPAWASFQEKAGRAVIHFGKVSGVVLPLPFGKKFVWIQKAPAQVSHLSPLTSHLPKGTVFVRLEPGQITEAALKKYGLRKVGRGSLLTGQASPKATRVLDISGFEDDILAQMKPKTRYNIRLAQKKGVVTRVLDNADALYDLLIKTAGRDRGYAPHEKSYYAKMIKTLSKNDVAHVFVAEHDGVPLAATLVSFYGAVATYLHGGFDVKKRNLMAPFLCQWEAIRYAKAQGCKYYDFWGVAETDDPADPWAGISRFKEGFGGERVIFPGSYDLVIDIFWYNILTIVARLKHLFR